MIIVFTDLDGSLLDSETYSWEPARPALELLERLGVPWVLVSSKTLREMEQLREDMAHRHPFVVENGGAAFIPAGYFGAPVAGVERRDGYEVLEWGTPYPDLVRALRAAAAATQCPVTGFHEMTGQALSATTGLPPARAALALQRAYDEAFSVPDRTKVRGLLDAIEGLRLRWTHGGRFYHICGNNDKATAVTALTRLFAKQHGSVTTIGLGDSLNDLPLLRVVDIPVFIRSRRPPSIHFRAIGAHYTRSAGPKGWNEAVTALLAHPPIAAGPHPAQR
jgi:mannosyl-3-phosphoglycerate phosphatase